MQFPGTGIARLDAWFERHPGVLVFILGLVAYQWVDEFMKAMEWRAGLRADMARAVSESLGG